MTLLLVGVLGLAVFLSRPRRRGGFVTGADLVKVIRDQQREGER